MKGILGGQFETSIRILVLLEAAYESKLTEGEIIALDFIVLYARDFGIADTNLHGDNQYRFSEFPALRELVKQGIKDLVLDRLIDVAQTQMGFQYSISSSGFSFSSKLDSLYANEYYNFALNVMNTMKNKSEEELTAIINQRAINSVQRG